MLPFKDGDVAEANSKSENTTAQPENSNAGTSMKRPRLSRAAKEILIGNSAEFMSNFDPESSNREKRKLTRKFTFEVKKNGTMHGENGVLNGSQKDTCDCLSEGCPGCHFPCLKCRSCKCGVECRVNRKWAYELIENEGELSLQKPTPAANT